MFIEALVVVGLCAGIWWFCCAGGRSRGRYGGFSEHRYKIVDKYDSLEEVQQAIRNEGLESCNLVIGELLATSVINKSYKVIIANDPQNWK